MAHPNSLANLKPWRPGESGNPRGTNGSTKDRESLEGLVEEILNEVDAHTLATRRRQLIESVLRQAEAGRPWAVKAVLDRLWPIPSQRLVAAQPPVAYEPPQDLDVDQIAQVLETLAEAGAIPSLNEGGS